MTPWPGLRMRRTLVRISKMSARLSRRIRSATLRKTEDFKEGVKAMADRRVPIFTGRYASGRRRSRTPLRASLPLDSEGAEFRVLIDDLS